MKVATPHDLLLDELRDLLDAEKQLTRALPKMAKSANDPELQQAFRNHLDATREQVRRLEQVFGLLESPARGKPCRGMKGLVEEGQEIMSEDRSGPIMDCGIASAARRVEHYEIAGYETARAMAQQLGRRDAAQLLEQTLQEEMQADKLLSQLSRRLFKEASQERPAEIKEARGRARVSSRRGRRVAAAGRSMIE